MNEPYLIVAADFVRTGGMDMANYALAAYLAEHGTEVHLAAYCVSEDLARRSNVVIHRVRKIAGSYFLSEPVLEAVGRMHARRIAKRGGRVLVNGGNCRWGGLNWVHYVHAAWSPVFGKSNFRGRVKSRIARRRALSTEAAALSMARIVVANSVVTKRHLIERLGVPERRVRTVYYGIDRELFRPPDPQERCDARQSIGWPDDRPFVVFVGAMGDRRKGFDTLFHAWCNLCAHSSWDAIMAVVGVGSEVPFWTRRAAEAGLSDRIRFMGFRTDVPRVLAAADALVAPTRYEAYGLGVHEALCCGLPAFVSASAGVAERYTADLEDLLIRDPDDAGELAAQLRQWRRDYERYKAPVLRLSDVLRRRTWDDMAADIAGLSEETV